MPDPARQYISDAERVHYREIASSEDVQETMRSMLQRVKALCETAEVSFGDPVEPWLDAPYDAVAQADAYRHIAPIEGHDVLQLGGMGSHAVAFLLGGAASAVLLTPVVDEAIAGLKLADELGVYDGFRAVVGAAEALPFRSGYFRAIYAGGCVHHMQTELALPEAARVLQPDGRFAAVEPWRAPLYDLGIRVFGQRERNVGCQPLDTIRSQPFLQYFPGAVLRLHGAITRYPLLALYKLRVRPKHDTLYRISLAEERVTDHIPWLKRRGSSLAMLGIKTAIPSPQSD